MKETKKQIKNNKKKEHGMQTETRNVRKKQGMKETKKET